MKLTRTIVSAIIISGIVATSNFSSGSFTSVPFVISASAASASELEQLRNDLNTLTDHISRYSYIAVNRSYNRAEAVRAYQRICNSVFGGNLAVDGIYGTRSAVFARDVIQAQANITRDGKVGKDTLNFITKKVNAYIDVRTPHTTTASFDGKVICISPSLNASLCADVERASNDLETNLGTYYYHGGDNQKFSVSLAYDDGSSQYYRFCPLSDSSGSMCVDINWGGNFGNCQLYSFNRQANQVYELVPAGNDFYYIRCYADGYLEVDDIRDGGNIFMNRSFTGSAYQQWRIIDVGGKTPSITIVSPEPSVTATTSADLEVSDKGLQFICGLEGFSATCYRDSSQSSIGYGTKCGTYVHESGSHTITREQAWADMSSQIASRYAPNVRRQTSGVRMNQSKFDALVSLCYNTGGGTSIISNSPLVKYLKGELSEQQARSLYAEYYVKSNGKRLQGLVNRRNREAELFFS